MLEPLRQRILDGMPVYGSCAGLILLCKEIEGSDPARLGRAGRHRAPQCLRPSGGQRSGDRTLAHRRSGPVSPLRAVFIRAPLHQPRGRRRAGAGTSGCRPRRAHRGRASGQCAGYVLPPRTDPGPAPAPVFPGHAGLIRASAEKQGAPRRTLRSRGALLFLRPVRFFHQFGHVGAKFLIMLSDLFPDCHPVPAAHGLYQHHMPLVEFIK